MSCRINRRLSLKRKRRWAVCEKSPRLPMPSREAVLTTRPEVAAGGPGDLQAVAFHRHSGGVGVFIGYWDTVRELLGQVGSARAGRHVRALARRRVLLPHAPPRGETTYEPNGDVPTCPICRMPLSVREKGEAVPCPRA